MFPQEITKQLVNKQSFNLIQGIFTALCHHIPIFIKIGRTVHFDVIV